MRFARSWSRLELTSVLRVDAGHEFGMGHLVRMYALSHALGERGIAAHFLTASSAAREWLRVRGLKNELLDVDAGSYRDTAAVLEYADKVKARWIVTDGCHLREEYLNSLVGGGVPVISIDDMGRIFFPSALVVNGGVAAGTLQYKVSAGTTLLLGPEYLILRPEFRRRRVGGPSEVKRIIVCFGGADPEDYTGRVLDILTCWPEFPRDIEVNVVAGSAYGKLGELRQRAESCGARVLSDIAAAAFSKLMLQSDLAITSAGMVACEIAATGLASILIVISEDQLPNATALAAAGAARVIDPLSEKHLLTVLEELLSDRGARQAMAKASRHLVDGLGRERVADAILSLQ